MYGTMRELENTIRHLRRERAYLIDRFEHLYRYDGDSRSVILEKDDFTDAIITHNHPADETGFSDSFGKDDYEFLRKHPEIKELRAVNPKYDYKLQLLKPLDLSYHEAELGGMELALENGNYDELQHNTMKWLEKKGYIKYTRREAQESS